MLKYLLYISPAISFFHQFFFIRTAVDTWENDDIIVHNEAMNQMDMAD